MQLVTAMTAYNQPDALAEVLRQYSSDYFDEITVDKETDSNSSYVDCQKGANTLRIEVPKSAGDELKYHVIVDGDTQKTFEYYSRVSGIYKILVTDNCLVFFPAPYSSSVYTSSSGNFAAPVILCKNNQNDMTLVYRMYNKSADSVYDSVASSGDTMLLCIVTFGHEDSTQVIMPDTNTTDFSLCYSIAGKCGVCKGIYWSANRCFYQVAQPFLFQHDGQTLCSVAYQTFCIKTT